MNKGKCILIKKFAHTFFNKSLWPSVKDLIDKMDGTWDILVYPNFSFGAELERNMVLPLLLEDTVIWNHLGLSFTLICPVR